MPPHKITDIPDVIDRDQREQQIRSLQSLLDTYRTIYDRAPLPMLFFDSNTIVRYANKAACRLFGISHKHLIGLRLDNYLKHPTFRHILRQALDRGSSEAVEYFTDNRGDRHAYFIRLQTICYPDGSLRGTIGVIFKTGLSDFVNQDAVIAQIQAQRYFDAAGVMIVALDKDANIVRINQKGCEILGYTCDELTGKNWIDTCIPEPLREEIHKVFAQVITKDLPLVEHYENEVVTKSGELRTIAWHNSLISDFRGNVIEVLSTGEDITELKASRQALIEQKLYDPLTGLPNRLMLFDRLEHALLLAGKEHKKLSLICIDIDNFNIINDTYGHETGDILLKEVVSRLVEVIEPSDTLARFGGDEFLVITEDIRDAAQASLLAQKILDTIRNPFRFSDRYHYLTASIGIALFPENGSDAQTLVQMAETAMNRAKKEGKAQFSFYTAALGEKLYRQMQLENNLHNALDNDEFELFYQPQFSLENGKVTGMEALVRWRSPELGLVSPLDFIPAAERSRLIIPLGRWIMTQACIFTQKLYQKGIFNGKISVNVSGIQMEYDDLLDTIDNALEISGFDPSKLEIEITESVLMINPQRWIDLLEEVKNMGISVAIDDFGTGYSSLSYLRHFSLNTLKIDKTFVDDLPDDDDACAIVKTIIALADTLGLETIAEGIETRAQLSYLRQIGATQAQGYIFAKPMDEDTLQDFLKKQIESNRTI